MELIVELAINRVLFPPGYLSPVLITVRVPCDPDIPSRRRLITILDAEYSKRGYNRTKSKAYHSTFSLLNTGARAPVLMEIDRALVYNARIRGIECDRHTHTHGQRSAGSVCRL